MSITANKPIMDKAFEALCIKGDGTESGVNSAGIVYKSAFNAYFKKLSENLPTSMDDISSDEDTKSKLENFDGITPDRIRESLVEDAHQFAECFTDAMSECLKEISTQIDNHVKAVADGLLITMLPQGIGTIVSPTGPCTGSMIIQNKSTAEIQIL